MSHPNDALARRVGDEIEATRRHLAALLELQRDLISPEAQAVEFMAGARAAAEATARALNSSYHEVISGRRHATVSRARQAVCLVLWRMGLTYAAIGRELRQKAHRSCIDGVRSGQAKEMIDSEFKAAVVKGVAAGLGSNAPEHQARAPRERKPRDRSARVRPSSQPDAGAGLTV